MKKNITSILQQEFGTYAVSNNRNKKPSSRKHLQKILPTEEGEKKLQSMRRKMNSETFDAFFGQDLQAKSSLLTGIYSPSKTKNEETLKANKIVAPPPTLTSDMGVRTLSSAKSEVDVAASKSSLKSRQLGFQSPDERGQLQGKKLTKTLKLFSKNTMHAD